MKKSLLNIAVSIAIASAAFSASALTTQAYASNFIAADNDSSNSKTTETYLLPGMATGAATGTAIAGPVGLLIGGIIGAVFGASQQISEQAAAIPTDDAVSLSSEQANNHISVADSGHAASSIQLAQIGEINSIIDDQSDSPQENLMNILVTDLSLDVYFRSGSSDIEKFYPARLSAIADLINTMDKLELHLDGYSDRRGKQSENIALANQRVEKVRQQLINAGVDEKRIISKAFGEIKMVSQAGDLEAYTFDRKVVIRFERMPVDATGSKASILSNVKTEDVTASVANEEDNKAVLANATSRF